MDLKKQVIYRALREQEGLINFKDVKQQGLSYYTLQQMIENEEIVSGGNGIYSLPNVYVDEWYEYQHQYPKGIYSLDTALWLHNLILTVPFQPTMSFPYGTNTKRIRQNGITPIILRSHYDAGIETISRQPNQIIRLYSKERTLAECLRTVYNMDVQIIAEAFQNYMKGDTIRLDQLNYFGTLFKVSSKLQSYVEVLL